MGTHTDNAATALALAGITPADYLRRAASLLDDAHHAIDASELGLRSWLKVQIDELHSEAARLDAPPSCPICHDTRSVRTECVVCAGSGELDRGGTAYVRGRQACADCSGLGYIADECPTCSGQQSDDESSPVWTCARWSQLMGFAEQRAQDERELELRISEDRLEQLTGAR
jgi:hypothetical protein